MPQSLVQVYLHIVFSTKNRTPFLNDKELQKATHAYLAGACSKLNCPAIIVGGVEDHVHLLCRMGKQIEIATFIRDLKRESSKWIKSEGPGLEDFYWQRGYGVFSISPSHIEMLTDYIKNQEEHHRHESFQDEFRRLCKKYGMEIDEKYVWE